MYPHNSLLLEVDADGGVEARIERAVGVLIEKTRFPHARIAERKELEQIIVIHFRFFSLSLSFSLLTCNIYIIYPRMEIRAKQKNARARWRCYMFIYERCARRAQTCPRVPNLRTRPPVGLCVRHSATSPPCYLLSHDPHVSVLLLCALFFRLVL